MSLYKEVKNIVNQSLKLNANKLTTVTEEHSKTMELVVLMATDPLHRERILKAASDGKCDYILYRL